MEEAVNDVKEYILEFFLCCSSVSHVIRHWQQNMNMKRPLHAATCYDRAQCTIEAISVVFRGLLLLGYGRHFLIDLLPSWKLWSLIFCCCCVCSRLMVQTKRESKFNILLMPHSQVSRIQFSADEEFPQHLQYITTNVQSEIGHLPAAKRLFCFLGVLLYSPSVRETLLIHAFLYVCMQFGGVVIFAYFILITEYYVCNIISNSDLEK